MADAGLDMMPLHIWPKTAAQFLGSQRLADSTDIVAFTFDAEECSASDRARIDAPAAPFELTQRQCMLLKHRAYRL